MFFFKAVLDGALAAVQPRQLINQHIQLKGDTLFIQDHVFDLSRYESLHVLGAGKGVTCLWEGLADVLGSRIVGGVVVGLPEHAFSHPTVSFFPGSHPIPDDKSEVAGRAMLAYVHSRIKPQDLVFFLLTGGASALLVQAVDGVCLSDKMAITRLLLSCGADIREINTVRKVLSSIKGGKLAQQIAPAQVISLIVSDIVDSPLGDIGSGPTIPSSESPQEVCALLEHYQLMRYVPEGVKTFLQNQLALPRKSPVVVAENMHFLLADNRLALVAAQQVAQKMGIPAYILTSREQGDVAAAATWYGALMKEIIFHNTPFKSPVLLLSGGELTVTLAVPPGEELGKGGRNQEFLLHILNHLKGINHPFFVASIGTDGIDGPTDAAGGWINHETMAKLTLSQLTNSIRCHNAYPLLDAVDQLIKTGPTGTNVMDLRLFYIDK